MDYLRSLSSAAASSLLQKSGIAFPFSLGEKVQDFEGKTLWSLYDATKRDDSLPISVFLFDSTQPPSNPRRSLLPLAKNALRKLRAIRHPDVLKFIDVVETDTAVYIVTERVVPLGKALKAWAAKGARAREDWLVWGLHRVTVALAFINDKAASTHGNIRVDSIFISPSGEWKLGGFDLLSSPKDDQAVLYTYGGLVPDASSTASPEIKKSGWSVLKELDIPPADSYALGLLIHSVFNPSHPLPATTNPPHPAPTPSSRGAIPTFLFPHYKNLLKPAPKARLSAKGFLEVGMMETATGSENAGFFVNNPLVKVCAGLENFGLAGENEKNTLLRTLKDSADSFPPEFASFKVLPSLTSALEYSGGTASTILPLVLLYGKSLPAADYTALVLAPLVKLFASPDRGTRMALLEHLEAYAERLDQRTTVDKVWPNLQTGFTDTVAVIREATVRSIILISSKLNDRILNNDLLRHLAKMQMDPEPSIRTNTCILIGRLAPTLSRTTKQKMLVPAFSRSLRDAFVHARVAGLMAFMATVECFEAEEVAGKVLPSITGTLVDKEKLVRDQAFKAVDLFIKRLESHAATMPVTAIPPTVPGAAPGTQGTAAASVQTTIVNSAAGAAGALAGWAISSINKQLAAGELGGTVGAAPDRPSSAPPASSATNGLTGKAYPQPLTNPSRSTPFSPLASAPITGPSTLAPSASRPKGLQLRPTTAPPDRVSSLLAEVMDDEADADADGANAWDGEDLMDVNADTDDWSAFETAPPEVVIQAPVAQLHKSAAAAKSGARIAPPAPPVDEDDEWEDTEETPHFSLSTNNKRPPVATPTPISPPAPVKPIATPRAAPQRAAVISPAADAWGSFPEESASPEPEAAGGGSTSLAGLSKEEKAAEMARRREERKQRIAQLKEKKGGR